MAGHFPVYAEVRMSSTSEHSIRGFVTFEQHQESLIQVNYQFSNLPVGRHAMHVHFASNQLLPVGDVTGNASGQVNGRLDISSGPDLMSLVSQTLVVHAQSEGENRNEVIAFSLIRDVS